MLLRPLFWIPVLLLAWAAAAFYAGDRTRNAAWLAQQAAQQQAAQAQLVAEQARGDALTSALVASLAKIEQLKQEAHRALLTKTTGRTCFDAAAVGVLQHTPGISVLPTPAAGADAALGATASAGGVATAAGADYALTASDTQVAHWAVDAGAAYEVCRARLDALIDWNLGQP